MINDLLNIVFFAAFSLSASFLCSSVIEMILLTGNFNQKLSSTCCAFLINDFFCLPKSFYSLYFRFFGLLRLVVTSGCKTGYCSLRIFISFIKLLVVINITKSDVRSQTGSCAGNSLTLVFLNFLRLYCLLRSLESLYFSFPVLLNLFRANLR